VRPLTIAIGMPVGVLKAGNSLSAISTALFLNICKQTANKSIPNRIRKMNAPP